VGVTGGHVRAAGGIVTRTSGGTTEVVLVHRPAYDDWTLPKGKALAGERDEECALREVEEETGLRCELGQAIDEIEYLDNRGRQKTVKYFAMRPLGGALEAQGEIDEARWVALDAALDELSYEHDRELLRAFTRPGR
jgi:8-oxo-dGTP diphosphatase